MSDWPVGLSTGCLCRKNILESLSWVRQSGFDMVEICSVPGHLDYRDREAVSHAARHLRDLWLEPYSFHAPFAEHIDITSLDPSLRNGALQEILRAAEAAAVLGVRHFVIHPGPESDVVRTEERLQRMSNAVDVLNRISRRCRELGMHLVLENMLPHLFSGHVRDLLWILGALESVEVGICLDTGHAQLSGDIGTVVHKLSGHLWMVHASDNRKKYDDHLPPGDGDLDWEKFLRQLSGTGFKGALILEIAGGDDVETVLEAAQKGRHHLREVSRRLGSF